MSDKLLVHKHLIIRAEALNPPTDTSYLTNCINKLAVGCCLLNQCKCKEYEKRSKSKNINGS